MAGFHIIYASAAGAYSRELAGFYAQGLRTWGHDVRCDADVLPDAAADFRLVVCPTDYRAYYLLDALGINPLSGHPLSSSASRRHDWQPPVLFSQEAPVWAACLQLWPGRPQGAEAELGRDLALASQGVLTAFPGDDAWWAASGVPVCPLLFPYAQEERGACMAPETRPGGLVFFGTESRRRAGIISAGCGDLDQVGHAIYLVPGDERVQSATPGACFGEQRDALLGSVKILLSVRRQDTCGFDWQRALMAAAHGCAFACDLPASESGSLHFPPGLYESSATLVSACGSLLEQPDELGRMVAAARRWFNQQCKDRGQWSGIEGHLRELARPPALRPRFSLTRGITGPQGRGRHTLRVVRRYGLEKVAEQWVASASPCILGLKPDKVSWPLAPGGARIHLDLRRSGVLLDRVVAETRMVIEGKAVDERHELPVRRGRAVLLLPPGALLMACSLVVDVAVGLPLSAPKVWWEQVAKRKRSLPIPPRGNARRTSPECTQVAAPPDIPAGADPGDRCHVERNFSIVGASVPRVSVVVPLYNYASYIGEAIASVMDAAAVLGKGATELIVVDDASTDKGADAVRSQLGSNLPITLAVRRDNHGLACARNLGTALARAPYICFLDADNLLLPHGLSRVLERAEPCTAPAAFGILAVFSDSGSVPEGKPLVSQFAWNPRRLVRGNYIDALALFHKATLTRLGGYDPSLAALGAPGWEDYDLWLRFLAHGLTPVFVPAFVGKYRKHGDSMMDRHTSHDETVMPMLRARYPGVFACTQQTHSGPRLCP